MLQYTGKDHFFEPNFARPKISFPLRWPRLHQADSRVPVEQKLKLFVTKTEFKEELPIQFRVFFNEQ